MKQSYLFLFVNILLLASSANAQWVNDSVSIDAQYADQVWYNMESGVEASDSLKAWDLAFEASGISSTILVNNGAGANAWLYSSNLSDWASVDTTGLVSQVGLFNSDTSWEVGALNQPKDPSDAFDMGWGTYSLQTHQVSGNRIFVIQTTTGVYKKMKVNGLVSGEYEFVLANLDGSDEVTVQIAKTNYPGVNFAYYNVEDDRAFTSEPQSADWQLLFTKYAAIFPTIGGYPSSGVLLNKNVKAVQVYPVADDYVSFGSHPFDSNINTIGYDWKSINFTTYQWDIQDSNIYFVETQEGNVWRIKFTAFSGSSSGKYYFSKELIFENNSTGTEEFASEQNQFSVYPNPVSNGMLNVAALLSNQQEVTYSIYSLSGTRMLSKMNTVTKLGVETIDVSSLSTGLYLLEVAGEGFKEVHKVSVK